MKSNKVVIAAAGSRKTQAVIDWALEPGNRQVLITTYTQENQRQIESRIQAVTGVLPDHIKIMGWFEFLIRECIKPYQVSITGRPNLIRRLNFKGSRNRYTAASDWEKYYLDSHHDVYREGAARLACEVNAKSLGASIRRLERAYGHILIDEVQDLVAYDLEWLDQLLASRIRVTAVGDPRQHTLATSNEPKNRKYRGQKIVEWFKERAGICQIETRRESHRCNQAICDFGDALFPVLPSTRSVDVGRTGHDGLFVLTREDVPSYYRVFTPQVLRRQKNQDTEGLTAMNIGVSKGSTFERILLFPTANMVTYLESFDLAALREVEKLYVAVTRARYSVAFVVPSHVISGIRLQRWSPPRSATTNGA